MLTPIEEASLTLKAGEAGNLSLSGFSIEIPEGALSEAVDIGAGLFHAADLWSRRFGCRFTV